MKNDALSKYAFRSETTMWKFKNFSGITGYYKLFSFQKGPKEPMHLEVAALRL